MKTAEIIEKQLKEDIHKVKFQNKVIHFIVAFTSLLLITCLGIIYFWATYPYDVLTFSNGHDEEVHILPVINKDKTVESGGYLELNLNFCKHLSVTGQSKVELVGITRVPLNWPPDRTPKSCVHDRILPIKMPVTLTTDKRYIDFTITYKINPLRTVTENFRTEEFTILKTN